MVHPLAIVTPDDPGTTTTSTPTASPSRARSRTALVNGMVQPKSAREVALNSQGGAEMSDHTIFLPSMHVSTAAYIRDDPDAGRRFEVDRRPLVRVRVRSPTSRSTRGSSARAKGPNGASLVSILVLAPSRGRPEQAARMA
jgi:hypothetical protein